MCASHIHMPEIPYVCELGDKMKGRNQRDFSFNVS